MPLTNQQRAIVQSSGNIRINAVAGSGKTATLVEYARARSGRGRMLYLAFNRSARREARNRFREAGVRNVDVQTAHSLAYRNIVFRHGYSVVEGYRAHEVRDMLEIKPVGKHPHSDLVLASHILRLCALFCNHATPRVKDLDYAETVTDPAARGFVERHNGRIVRGARELLAKMDRKEIAVSHDFYLKKFQLSRPLLPYDIVLFDEGQDASPVMLDVFVRQGGTKVIVGDAHQQIYGWRHAINALGKVDFRDYLLSASFRFGQPIADFARECLSWKRHLGVGHADVVIEGLGRRRRRIRTRATLARTNVALLKAAAHFVMYRRGTPSIFFEGNLNSYLYARNGTSLYDVLNLSLGNMDRVRDPLARKLGSFEALGEYADQTGDNELSTMIDLVDEFGRDLPRIMKRIRECSVAPEHRDRAEMVFSTVHKAKGLEYDDVTMEDDFVNEPRVKSLAKKPEVDRRALAEEINLVYVAATRARSRLKPSSGLAGTTASSMELLEEPARRGKPRLQSKRCPKAGAKWASADEALLKKLFSEGESLDRLATRFGRSRNAVHRRMVRMGLVDG